MRIRKRRVYEKLKSVIVYYKRSVSNLGMFINIYNASILTYLLLASILELINIPLKVIVGVGVALIILAGVAGRFDYSEEGTYAKEAEIQARRNPFFQLYFMATKLFFQGKIPEALEIIDFFYDGSLENTLKKTLERIK